MIAETQRVNTLLPFLVVGPCLLGLTEQSWEKAQVMGEDEALNYPARRLLLHI